MAPLKTPSLTGAQIRAARALLRWSARDLAKYSGVSHSAIARAEKFDQIPPMQERNLQAIKSAFEFNGIEFLDRSGVRVNR